MICFWKRNIVLLFQLVVVLLINSIFRASASSLADETLIPLDISGGVLLEGENPPVMLEKEESENDNYIDVDPNVLQKDKLKDFDKNQEVDDTNNLVLNPEKTESKTNIKTNIQQVLSEGGDIEDSKVQNSEQTSNEEKSVEFQQNAKETIPLANTLCGDKLCPFKDATCCIFFPNYCCPPGYACKIKLNSNPPVSCFKPDKFCSEYCEREARKACPKITFVERGTLQNTCN